jgi:hypothetical protein
VSLRDVLRTFRSRSRQERGLFIEAFALLGVMRAAILLVPFRKISAMMGLVPGTTSTGDKLAAAIPLPAISWAVQAAAARTPWESACLAQALTAMLMLSRRGVAATLYLGVAKNKGGAEAMAAHAWLRCGESILTGAAGVERFSAISSFSRPATGATHQQCNRGDTCR